MEPAVTVPQMERIMRSVAVSTTEADASTRPRSPSVHRPGARGPRRPTTRSATLPEHPAPTAIPAAPLTLTLPQQVAGLARADARATIAKNSDDPTVAPTARAAAGHAARELQDRSTRCRSRPTPTCPRSRLRRSAPLISPEFKGLVMPPGQVAAYADVLLKGDESEFATLFDPEGDVLREQLGDGPAGDQRRPAADGRHRVLERRRRSPTVALATNDSVHS